MMLIALFGTKTAQNVNLKFRESNEVKSEI